LNYARISHRAHYRVACQLANPRLPQIDLEAIEQAINDQQARKAIVKGAWSFGYFCLIYLPHYFPLSPAVFFPELIAALQDDKIDRLEEIDFRARPSNEVGKLHAIRSCSKKPNLTPKRFRGDVRGSLKSLK